MSSKPPRRRVTRAVILVVLAALAAYAAIPRNADLTAFDPAETARLNEGQRPIEAAQRNEGQPPTVSERPVAARIQRRVATMSNPTIAGSQAAVSTQRSAQGESQSRTGTALLNRAPAPSRPATPGSTKAPNHTAAPSDTAAPGQPPASTRMAACKSSRPRSIPTTRPRRCGRGRRSRSRGCRRPRPGCSRRSRTNR